VAGERLAVHLRLHFLDHHPAPSAMLRVAMPVSSVGGAPGVSQLRIFMS
jgi:hypothetical protein